MNASNPNVNFTWLRKIARLMDSKFKLPGTKLRFGLDPILGIIPGLGDLSAFIVSAVLVVYMSRYGVSRKVIILMVLNIVFDFVIGSIPILGHVFDFAYKANNRNIRLLERHYKEGKYQGSGKQIIWTVGFVLFLILALFVFGMYKLLAYLVSYL